MSPAPQPKRILVVEDEPFVRHDLCDFFEDRGFEVEAAGTADDALRIIEDQPAFEVLLTDIRVPGSMDGLRLAHMVKERHPPTLVVVASGVVTPKAGELPEGAQFLPKPFNPRVVLQQLD